MKSFPCILNVLWFSTIFFHTAESAFRNKGSIKFIRNSCAVRSTIVQGTELQEARVRFHNVEQMLAELEDDSSVVVVMFSSDHCGPCRLQKKELRRLWLKRKTHVEHYHLGGNRDLTWTPAPLKILTIDMEKWPNVGRHFRVGKLPSLLVFHGDQENARRLEGLVSAEELWKHVENFDFLPEPNDVK